MWTRREVVAGGLLTLLYGISAPCLCQSTSRRRPDSGCVLTPVEAQPFLATATESRLFATGDEPMIPKSGNKNFDLALAQTLAKAAAILEVLPGFAYYDDYDGLNAYATSLVRRGRADGTVLFGQGMLTELMGGTESPEVAVAAVCAHEFGHILQFKRDLQRVVLKDESTVKRSELQADFFAGYFAGRKKLEKPDYPAAVVALTQSKMGDFSVGSEGHHGTPAERGAAVVAGFDSAFVQRHSLSEAIETSTNYVLAR